MKNILETIIEQKKIEVTERKQTVPVAVLEKMESFRRPVLSLKQFLLDESKTGIIAEFKRKSPSKGWINAEADPSTVTLAYTRHGASGLSVLTDEFFFGGNMDDLVKARVNAIPILRKDFMIDPYQIIEAKAYGADVILLIAANLNPAAVRSLAIAAKNMGLEVLLEIHNEQELEHICEEVDIVGVNNRNLKTFEVNIDTSISLSRLIPADKFKISESGIGSVETIALLKQYGYQGFLMGENFMKADDPGIAFAGFAAQLIN